MTTNTQIHLFEGGGTDKPIGGPHYWPFVPHLGEVINIGGIQHRIIFSEWCIRADQAEGFSEPVVCLYLEKVSP